MLKLYDAFLQIKNEREFNNFLADLCTPLEIRELKCRWKIAQNLYQKKISQQELSRKMKVGLATITRVSKCLNENSDNGYRTILNRIHNHP